MLSLSLKYPTVNINETLKFYDRKINRDFTGIFY